MAHRRPFFFVIIIAVISYLTVKINNSWVIPFQVNL